MARNDGANHTFVRNRDLKADKKATPQSAYAHNERKKELYSNPDIVPERTPMNVHFKSPVGTYEETFSALEDQKVISTWGLKPGSTKMCELIFDVNSAYFFNHGGYEFAKKFYAEAYQAAIKIVGGEQYILSAVMHADERNRAMSDALGQDVFHYHMHVVYVPVVEKKKLWSKRCKDPSLVGTVKEIIPQVSRSKKWESKPALDKNGEPLLDKNGKPVLHHSYSVLQDAFYDHMVAAGYTDVERGERGSSEEHLINKQHHRAKGEQEYHFSPLKNSRPRSLTAATAVMDALREQKRRQQAWAEAAGCAWDNYENLVFTTQLGRYINNKTLWMNFKRIVSSLGMPELRFHDLRHTFSINSLQAGDDIKTVQENLGHATAAFTLSTYAHATMGMKRESANRMDAFIRSVREGAMTSGA